MNADDLYFDHEELMTPEELEDYHREPNSSFMPDLPRAFGSWLRDSMLPAPEAAYRAKFEKRSPALGLSYAMLDEVSTYEKNPAFLPVQRRNLFSLLRCQMLRHLIPCSGCATIDDLLAILHNEISTGIPAAVPKWYKYSTVTMGPRRIGYEYCSKRGCLQTEALEHQFQKCSQCSIPFYCSRECQVRYFNQNYIKICFVFSLLI